MKWKKNRLKHAKLVKKEGKEQNIKEQVKKLKTQNQGQNKYDRW